MTTLHIYHFFKDRQKLFPFLVSCLMVLVAANIFLDYLFTLWQSSAFYFSESLLFSSFWILFAPIISAQLHFIKKIKKLTTGLLIICLAVLIHLTVYPALIWLLSKTFYDHTFPYWQTFNFGLTAYLIKSAIVYTFSFTVFTILKNKTRQSPPVAEEIREQNMITSMILSDSNYKKIIVEVSDIYYFSANSPYINVHHQSKKYLHNETLKSLETQLDSNRFVRIHKSHIVNIDKIIAYQSRQNGDYDITLSDQSVLRLSRNYAKDFRSKFDCLHLTSK